MDSGPRPSHDYHYFRLRLCRDLHTGFVVRLN